MITTTIQSFTQLSAENLYEILALRSAVFVVEQKCAYQDLDNRDQTAVHLGLYEKKQLIAYTRILPNYQDNAVSFGRLVTAPSHRGRGLARQLVNSAMDYLETNYFQVPIIITAQHYLQNFYKNFGFVTQNKPFDMDGILHILMEKR